MRLVTSQVGAVFPFERMSGSPDRERPALLAGLVVAVAGLVLGAGIIAATPLIKTVAVAEGADAAGEAFLAGLVAKIFGASGS